MVAAGATDIRNLIETVPVLIVVADHEGEVVFLNHGVKGLDPDELMGWLGCPLPFEHGEATFILGELEFAIYSEEVVWAGNLGTAYFLTRGSSTKQEELEAALARSQEEIASVSERLRNATDDREHMEEQLNEAQQVLVEAQEDLVKRERRVEELEAQSDRELARFKELEDRLRSQMDEKEELRRSHEEVAKASRFSEEKFESLRQELELLDEKLRETEGRAVIAESSRSAAEEKATRYQQLFDDLEVKAHDAIAKLALTEDRLRSAQERADRYQRLSRGSVDHQQLDQEMEEFQTRAKEAEARVLELEEQLAARPSSEPEEGAPQVDAQALEDLRHERDEALEELAHKGEELETARERLKKAQTLLAGSKNSLEKALARVAELEEAGGAPASSEEGVTADTGDGLQERLQEANRRADEMEERCRELEEQLAAHFLTSRPDPTDSEKELREKLEKSIRDANNAIQRADKLEKRCMELQEDLSKRPDPAAERETQKLAYADQLTGLPNFNILQQYLKQTYEKIKDEGGAAVLLVMDVDRFRIINDTFGQKAGDDLLKAIGKRLLKFTKNRDYTLARRGEDEFIVLASLAGSRDKSQLDALARGVGHSIVTEMGKPFEVNGQAVHVGVSIGIALYPGTAESVEQLLDQAETAVYQAKDKGRGRIVFFSRELHDAQRKRLELETQIRSGIENDEFMVYYQPVIDLKTGKVAGLEALLRWGHPTRGLLEPHDFLKVAEDTGLIVPIGDRMLGEVTQLARGLKKGFIALNLSTRQLVDVEFSGRFMKHVQRAGIKPDRLVAEISETTSSIDPDRMQEALSKLTQWGVGIGIDEFGTGSTSLAQLSRISPRYLKIDREFVRQTPDDRASAQLCLAVANLSAGLNMTSSAVGVETEAQAAYVAKCGCTYAQGNFFSAPCPPTHLKEIMGKRWSI